MNTDKDKLLAKLLEGDPLDDNERTQVTDDAELSGITEFLHAIKDLDLGDDPPASLDAAVRADIMGSKPVRKTTPILVYVRLGLAATAAFLIVMIVLQLIPSSSDSSNTIAGPDVRKKPGIEFVTPNRLAVPDSDNQVARDDSNDDIPEFDWVDGGTVETELAMLEAELFFKDLDDNEAALVENF